MSAQARPETASGERWKNLAPYFEILCASEGEAHSLEDAYEAADREAVRLKNLYRFIVLVIAAAGLWALASALGRIIWEHPPVFPLWVELLAALVACVSFVVGWRQEIHKRWLLARHRSERLRLLKFGGLADPRFWALGTAERQSLQADVCREAADIQHMSAQDMPVWAGFAVRARQPVSVENASLPASEVADYYRRARLADQLAYFLAMAERAVTLEKISGLAPEVGFGAGVVLAIVLGFGGLVWNWEPQWLLFTALLLPVFGAAVKVVRGAFEFGRNRQRFQATYTELRVASQMLDAAGEDPTAVAAAIAEAEASLEREHREWLRLMLHAEWF